MAECSQIHDVALGSFKHFAVAVVSTESRAQLHLHGAVHTQVTMCLQPPLSLNRKCSLRLSRTRLGVRGPRRASWYTRSVRTSARMGHHHPSEQKSPGSLSAHWGALTCTDDAPLGWGSELICRALPGRVETSPGLAIALRKSPQGRLPHQGCPRGPLPAAGHSGHRLQTLLVTAGGCRH